MLHDGSQEAETDERDADFESTTVQRAVGPAQQLRTDEAAAVCCHDDWGRQRGSWLGTGDSHIAMATDRCWGVLQLSDNHVAFIGWEGSVNIS